MKVWVIVFALILFITPVIFVARRSKLTNQSQLSNMKITSSAYKEGEKIPVRFTCKGENINPPLSISDIPEKTLSLALTLDDPDAPIGVFHHWLIWNILPTTKEIAENSTPSGAITGTSSAGNQKYHGPCPPSGSHRYIFTIYALDTTLTLPPEAKTEDLLSTISSHIIGKSSLMGKFP